MSRGVAVPDDRDKSRPSRDQRCEAINHDARYSNGRLCSIKNRSPWEKKERPARRRLFEKEVQIVSLSEKRGELSKSTNEIKFQGEAPRSVEPGTKLLSFMGRE